MSVSPSLVLNDSTAAVVADPTDAPVVGKPARKLASAQGFCWEAIEQTVAIASHGESFTTVDAQGDALAGLLAQLLARLAASARREGAHQTAAMAQDAVAVFARMLEMDAAEDWHVGQMAARAVHATGSSRQASAQIGAVLGQHDAVRGHQRTAEGGNEFDPCGQPAGHTLDGTVCVCMARIGGATAPKSRGSRRAERRADVLIEFPPVRSLFAEVLEMDGLPAYEIEGRVWTDALHRHRPEAPARVEIRAWGDVDALIDDARRCHIDRCAGRETARRIDAARQAELSDLCAFVGAAR